MTGWTDIYDDVDGSPVRGVPSEFRSVRDHFGTMEENGQSIVSQFERFRDDGQATGSLEGDAAEAFARFIDEVGGELDDVPRVAGEAHGLFEHHATELDRMLEATEDALARARTAWNSKNDLEESAERLRAQVSQLQSQVSSAEDDAAAAPEPDPGAQDQIDQLNGQLGSAAGGLRDTQEAIDHQVGVLNAIRDEWGDIRGEENALNQTTVDGIGGIDLGDLEDPGMFERIVGGVADFVGAVVDIALGPLDEILVALVNGDWATLLWELKELLDTVLVVLAVVALFFPLTAPFVIGMFVLSALALTVNAGLYFSQTPNPQTGETVGLGDVLLSAVGVAFAGAGAVQAFRSVASLSSSFVQRSGYESLLSSGRNFRSVLTGGDDAAAAAASLRINTLPFPPGTPLTTSIPALLRAPGGAFATSKFVWDLNGAMPLGSNIIPGLPSKQEKLTTGVTDGSAVDGLVFDDGPPSPTVFNQIAYRQRFDPTMHWNHPSLPWGQQLHIVPA